MKLTDAEWAVMNAVWRGFPATVRDVHARAGKETAWAYTTVKTMLARLVEKGALRALKRRNTTWFTPLVTPERARHSALRWLVDRAFGGTLGSLFQHLVSEERLSRRDRETLARLLADLDREERRKR